MACAKENPALDTIAQQVWQIIAAIPAGKISSYGQVAARAGYPNHARYVGRILSQLPKDSKLPWHRVVNAQGRISFAEGSPAYLRQRQLLEQEGLVFIAGKFAFKQYAF
jgi:methylated-DNA-protein-cysteine methyltransferase-like protein